MHTTSPPGWNAPALAAALQRLKDLGHTATELARLAHISRSQMSRWASGGHRPKYDSVRDLAAALLQAHPNAQYRDIVRDLCTAAGYPGVAADLGVAAPPPTPSAVEEEVDPYAEWAQRIVQRLERRAEDFGLTEGERRRMIDQALARAEEQATLMFDGEVLRHERGRSARPDA